MRRLLLLALVLAGCRDEAWERFRAEHHCEHVREEFRLFVPIVHSCGNGCTWTQMLPIYDEVWRCDTGEVRR